MATKPTPKKTSEAPSPKTKEAMVNPFKSKVTHKEVSLAAQPKAKIKATVKKPAKSQVKDKRPQQTPLAAKRVSKETSESKKPAKNPFEGKRDIKQAPLHAQPVPNLTPKAKSFSFYAEDLERLTSLREQLIPRSGKRVSDSVVVRVALAYLEEHLKSKDGLSQFERQVKDMLLRHS